MGYLLNAGLAIDKDEGDADNEHYDDGLTPEDITRSIFDHHNHCNVFKKSRTLTDLINNIQDKTDGNLSASTKICDKLEKKVTTEICSKLHEKFSQQKLNSDLQIMRLQQQLTNLAQQLNETKRIHQQIKLMHHSPLIMSNGSDQTQRISANLSNASSAQSIISHGSTRNDSPRMVMIDVPSHPYLYRFNSNLSSYSNKKPRLSIDKYLNKSPNLISPKLSSNKPPNLTANISSDSSPMKIDNVNKTFPVKKRKKIKKRNSKKICRNKVEKEYIEQQEKQKENALIWSWLNCIDLRACFKWKPQTPFELKEALFFGINNLTQRYDNSV